MTDTPDATRAVIEAARLEARKAWAAARSGWVGCWSDLYARGGPPSPSDAQYDREAKDE